MEKGSFCSNMKQRSISNSARNMKQMHEFKVNVSSLGYVSDYSSKTGEGDLVVGGFSWPPRSYVCSFCKREFRSAQALGGHMNVHRRDRARLRQSPTSDGGSNSNSGGKFSTLNLDLEPNPSFYSNPSFFSSSPPPISSLLTNIPQFTSKLPSLGLSSNEMKRCGGEAVLVPNRRPVIDGAKGLLDVERFEPSVYKRGRELARLDLEMGLVTPSKEELDLELRLGYT